MAARLVLHGIRTSRLAYGPHAGHDFEGLVNLRGWMDRVELLPGHAGPKDLLAKESRAA